MNQRDELLATVASLYYKLNRNQNQIAERLDMSASKVSRLLKEAHERGIVEVHIRMPIPRDFELEQRLIETFGMKDACILQTNGRVEHSVAIRGVGRLGAAYVQRAIEAISPGGTLGASWGESVFAVVEALPDSLARSVDVIQLAGWIHSYGFEGSELNRIVANKVGGRGYFLAAPCVVERAEIRDMLLQEPMIRDVIARAGGVYLAICGIGAVLPDCNFVRSGLLSWEEMQELGRQGIVGEMCGSFYDLDGRCREYAINHRTIGVSLDHLRDNPRVLAVARGEGKARAIVGALRGGYVKVLASDDITARAVLEIGSALPAATQTRRSG
jgi:DNA-binding transcriptional regulator LsrR (DeoR family)